jgi:hypothetical protein
VVCGLFGSGPVVCSLTVDLGRGRFPGGVGPGPGKGVTPGVAGAPSGGLSAMVLEPEEGETPVAVAGETVDGVGGLGIPGPDGAGAAAGGLGAMTPDGAGIPEGLGGPGVTDGGATLDGAGALGAGAAVGGGTAPTGFGGGTGPTGFGGRTEGA